MKSKMLLIFATVMLVIGLVVASCAPKEVGPLPEGEGVPAPTPVEPRTLKAAFIMPAELPNMWTQKLWIDEVAKVSNGLLTVEYLGSWDVMPMEEQVEACRSGVVDMTFATNSDLAVFVPLFHAMLLTKMTPWEEREKGIWDIYRAAAEKAGVYWMAQTQAPVWFILTSTEPIKSLEEVKGLQVRSMSTFLPSVEAVGASPVHIPVGDVYSACERGVMDAIIFPASSWLALGFGEVLNQWCGPRISFGQAGAPIINLDVWNSLSEQEQGWLLQPQRENEKMWYGYDYYLGAGPEQGEEAIVASGVERILWSEEDSEELLRLWDGAYWASIKDRIDPKYAAPFAEICGLPYP